MNPLNKGCDKTHSIAWPQGCVQTYKVKRPMALWHDEDGVTTVEYALLLAALIVGAGTIWAVLRDQIGGAVALAGSEVETAPGT